MASFGFFFIVELGGFFYLSVGGDGRHGYGGERGDHVAQADAQHALFLKKKVFESNERNGVSCV